MTGTWPVVGSRGSSQRRAHGGLPSWAAVMGDWPMAGSRGCSQWRALGGVASGGRVRVEVAGGRPPCGCSGRSPMGDGGRDKAVLRADWQRQPPPLGSGNSGHPPPESARIWQGRSSPTWLWADLAAAAGRDQREARGGGSSGAIFHTYLVVAAFPAQIRRQQPSPAQI